jgi:hypothetical protein
LDANDSNRLNEKYVFWKTYAKKRIKTFSELFLKNNKRQSNLVLRNRD